MSQVPGPGQSQGQWGRSSPSGRRGAPAVTGGHRGPQCLGASSCPAQSSTFQSTTSSILTRLTWTVTSSQTAGSPPGSAEGGRGLRVTADGGDLLGPGARDDEGRGPQPQDPGRHDAAQSSRLQPDQGKLLIHIIAPH